MGGILDIAWIFVLGILGASNLIIAKKPNAKELIGKLAPYQGWIGVVSACWGVWEIIQVVMHMELLSLGGVFMMGWLTLLGVGVIDLLLGFLLGFGVMKSFVKNPQASAKMDQTLAKLAPFQATLGLIAIGLGVWLVVYVYVILPGAISGMGLR